MIARIVGRLLSPVLGRKRFQRLFEAMYRLSLRGMNIGGGSSTEDSGEETALRYVARRLGAPAELTLFDVGANVGHYSLLLADVFGSRAAIHSFEPSHSTFQKLVSNVGTRPNIVPHNFGFGDKDASVTLYACSEQSGLASVYKRRLDHFNLAMDAAETVELRTADDFCQGQRIQQVHLMKLDVEGNEMKVLQGASGLLSSGNVRFIQFEFGGCNIDSRTFFQDFYYLLHGQYAIYRIVRDGLCPVGQYRETCEAFLTTNYLAERK
jgi:FkbM family methyltransferase